jgi:ATP-dependent Lon protease
MLLSISQIEDESKLADSIASHLTNLKLDDKQLLLQQTNPSARLEKIYGMDSKPKLKSCALRKNSVPCQETDGKGSKEYYLNEQMNAIQKELGDKDDSESRVHGA